MRYVLAALLLFTVGCGDDVTHPTYTPQTIYPPSTEAVCTVSNGKGLLIVPCD